MTGFVPVPRLRITLLLNPEEEVIDEGILLYFAAPILLPGKMLGISSTWWPHCFDKF